MEERRPRDWRHVAGHRSQANSATSLAGLAPASHEDEFRHRHMHGQALPLAARVGELRRRPWGAHPPGTRRACRAGGWRGSHAGCKKRIRPCRRERRAPARRPRRCSTGRMRDSVLHRRSRVLPATSGGLNSYGTCGSWTSAAACGSCYQGTMGKN